MREPRCLLGNVTNSEVFINWGTPQHDNDDQQPNQQSNQDDRRSQQWTVLVFVPLHSLASHHRMDEHCRAKQQNRMVVTN